MTENYYFPQNTNDEFMKPECSHTSDVTEKIPEYSFSLNEDKLEKSENANKCDIIKKSESEEIPMISKWPEIKTEDFIKNVIIQKPKSEPLENTEKLYHDGDKIYYRRLNESHFYTIKPNGGKEKRDWLI